MKQYELVLVLEGKASPAKRKAMIEKMTALTTSLSGKVLNSEDWGSLELAYPINKINTGVFLLLTLELGSKGAKDMLARLKLENSVIRSLFIVKEEPTRLVSAKSFKHNQTQNNDQES